MASVTPTSFDTGLGDVFAYAWVLANGDTGVAIKTANFSDKCVQIDGTFGASGSVTLRGSNKAAPSDATAGDWFTLTDPQANALTKTAAAGEQVLENPLWISPIVTAGDGTTALNIRIIAKRG